MFEFVMSVIGLSLVTLMFIVGCVLCYFTYIFMQDWESFEPAMASWKDLVLLAVTEALVSLGLVLFAYVITYESYNPSNWEDFQKAVIGFIVLLPTWVASTTMLFGYGLGILQYGWKAYKLEKSNREIRRMVDGY